MWLSVLKIAHHGSSVMAYRDFYQFVCPAPRYIIRADYSHKSASLRYFSLQAIIEGFGEWMRNARFVSLKCSITEADILSKDRKMVVHKSAVPERINSRSYRPTDNLRYEV